MDDRMLLAEPNLAVDLLCTLRHDGDGLVDRLADREWFRGWLRDHLGLKPDATGLSDAALAELAGFRDQLRVLFTAVVDAQPPPPATVQAVNDAAARAPVTLAAGRTADGELHIVRVPQTADALTQIRGEFARAALALLTDELRGRLRLCRAPSCVLFFLKQHPRQEWCSPSCGNRARVARHSARHRR